MIRAKLAQREGRLSGTIELPEDVRGTLIANGARTPLREGVNAVASR
jgi:hypothetical protein